MYLKNIEVQGFKSFANKINFEFHNGITGIVGPNGSGKSNVADAVRWVLGEQRIKQLRGGKMEDVIFSGTESRRPLGFAYVAITLDNSDHSLAIDFDEVTVSRRLFRSGESEYMINGAICRLKDVNELFYDTGIGKEGYSIIGQGQIDKILSGKPEERRELFDEAAGIVKYKRRKAVAQKKLEDERQNLIRVQDILSELEKQVKPLEKQSEKAREYLKLKDSLKTYDVNVFLLSYAKIKQDLQEVNEKVEIASKDLRETNQEYENIKIEYEKLEVFIENLGTTMEEKRNSLNQTILLLEKFEGEINVLHEQIRSSEQTEEQDNLRMQNIQENIASHQKEKEQLILEQNKINQELLGMNEVQKNADTQLHTLNDSIQEILNQIEDAKSEIIDLLNEKAALQAKIQRYDTMLEQINFRKSELAQKLIQFQSDKSAQEEIIADLKKESEEVTASIAKTKENAKQLSDTIESIHHANKDLTRQSEQQQQQFHMIHSKLESLKNMTERYEGYGNSIRKIMELKESKKGIIGVVADIIKVDKKYEIAIETALGGNIQNIVTDSEKTAKDSIEYLKKGKFGRATFLPLTSISNKTGFHNERVLSEQGVIGLACDLVHIKKEYAGIAKYLLGRIVVVNTIDNALVLARKYNYTLRMVTLEGELLHAGGSMTGGAFKNNSNLLGRRREIEEYESNLAQITKKQEELKEQLAKNRSQSLEHTEELEKVKLVLQEQILLQNTIHMNLEQAGVKQQEILENYEDFQKESSEISQQLQDITGNNQQLQQELTKQEDRNKELEETITRLSLVMESKQEEKQKQDKSNEDIRLEQANLSQKLSFIMENINRLEKEIQKDEEEYQNVLQNSSTIKADRKEKEKEIETIQESIASASTTKTSLEEELQHLQEEKESQAQGHKDFFQKREALSEKMSALDKELYRLNNQAEKLEQENENQINYMWNEYELTYSASLELRDEALVNLSQMKSTIVSLKNQIRALGDVNVNAIEDYKSVVERYEFLNTQHEDLIKAEESLIQIIEELDTGMRKQFTEKFALIRSEFDKVFKELFGGGKGTIELEEEEDILEAGIRIISQPPGKKLQNMMQLSGGEKALTAIALLFAIQNLKPSPFCLLDEIEAALDDSNVGRFASYLHKLTKFTQFIVITHRRGTMNAADRLYGITMQEKGVSTLVSVNLLEADLEQEKAV